MPRNLLLQAEFLFLPDDAFGASLPDFRECFGNALKKSEFEFSRIKFWVSQYRIGILVEGLPDSSGNFLKEIRGPKASVAYDYNNQPTPAAKGFAGAQGIELKDLVTKEVDGEKFLFAVKSFAGQQLESSLIKLKDALFSSIPFVLPPWNSDSHFPQPILNFTAMLDNKLLNIELEGVLASDEIYSRKNGQIAKIKIGSIQEYAELMNSYGLLSDPSERKKIMETRIRSVLPDGYRIRADNSNVNRFFLFSEGLNPVFVKYNYECLCVSEGIIGYYINNYTDYLPCEDALGKLLPAVIGFSVNEKPNSLELNSRSLFLNDLLGRLCRVWNNDADKLAAYLEKLPDSVFFNSQLDLFAEPSVESAFLFETICWLCQKLNCDANFPVLRMLAYLEQGLKDTDLSRNMSKVSLSLILSCLEKKDMQNRINSTLDVSTLISVLKEIQNYFLGKIPSPQTLVAAIFSFAFLMKLYKENTSFGSVYIKQICSLVIACKIRFDLFEYLQLFIKPSKQELRLWTSEIYRRIVKESSFDLPEENLLRLDSIDPAAFYDAVCEWKKLGNIDSEFYSLLNARIGSKIEKVSNIINELPLSDLEKELCLKLNNLEGKVGIDYLGIQSFFITEKINIEACLLNLPSVLDENDKSYHSRISLLQRIQKQLLKLPFVKRINK